jgi:hypothetical protein
MSGDRDDLGPHDLVARLSVRPGAVAALVTLYDNAGTATLGHLRRAALCATIATDIRWLAAAGLVRTGGSAGSCDLDDPDVTYRLTDLGASLTSSLAALASAYAALPPTGSKPASQRRHR